MAEPPLNENMKKALAILRTGNANDGETIMTNAVRDAVARFGGQSPEHAAAQFDLGCFLLAVQDMVGALAALRNACSIPPTSSEAIKAHLTYVMNLGDILIISGQLDEAERILREALKERESFYGTSHAGYAYGLEPLAKVLFKKGNPKEAVRLINQALNIFYAQRHIETPVILALRAPMLKAAFGPDKLAFDGLDKLPPEMFEKIAKECNSLAMNEEPR